jgi:hypothetical protein
MGPHPSLRSSRSPRRQSRSGHLSSRQRTLLSRSRVLPSSHLLFDRLLPSHPGLTSRPIISSPLSPPNPRWRRHRGRRASSRETRREISLLLGLSVLRWRVQAKDEEAKLVQVEQRSPAASRRRVDSHPNPPSQLFAFQASHHPDPILSHRQSITLLSSSSLSLGQFRFFVWQRVRGRSIFLCLASPSSPHASRSLADNAWGDGSRHAWRVLRGDWAGRRNWYACCGRERWASRR